MTPDELLPMVDRVATMNDRWLFVASLVVFGVFAIAVMRYFVRQHERLMNLFAMMFVEIAGSGGPRRLFGVGGYGSLEPNLLNR